MKSWGSWGDWESTYLLRACHVRLHAIVLAHARAATSARRGPTAARLCRTLALHCRQLRLPRPQDGSRVCGSLARAITLLRFLACGLRYQLVVVPIDAHATSRRPLLH